MESYTLYVRCGDDTDGAVPVCVTRKRVRNLNLRVRRDGSVVLSVPWRTSSERAQAFLDERTGWIGEVLARQRMRAQRREADAQAATGTYPLWGEPRETPDGAPVSPEELDALYRRELARALPEVVARMEPLIGARASSWQLRAMTSRWGSCTPKTGRVNFQKFRYQSIKFIYCAMVLIMHLLGVLGHYS